MMFSRIFPQGIRGLIFDCDGVLVNSQDANIAYYNMILEKLGKPALTPAQAAYAQMATSQQAIEQVLNATELELVPAICARNPYSQVSLPLLELEPGIRELLGWLRERGLRLAVHTNRGRGMNDVLTRFALHEVFDPVMTVERVAPKPDPEGIRHILAAWGLTPGEVGFVGDSLTDAGAAKAAGVPLLAYKNPSLDAAAHLTDFDALRAAIAAMPALHRSDDDRTFTATCSR